MDALAIMIGIIVVIIVVIMLLFSLLANVVVLPVKKKVQVKKVWFSREPRLLLFPCLCFRYVALV